MIIVKLLAKKVCGKIMYYPDSSEGKLYFKFLNRVALSKEQFKFAQEFVKSEKEIPAKILVREEVDW